MKNSEIDEFNKRLKERYGSTLDNKAHFRLVWSNDIYEIRVGIFNDFYGPILVRSYKGAREVRKYNYIHNRWILEMWHLIEPLPELPQPDGYECLYVFEDKNHVPLLVNWRVIELICFIKTHEDRNSDQIRNDIEAEQLKIFESDVKYFEDMFDMSAMMSRLHFGETILLPGKDF